MTEQTNQQLSRVLASMEYNTKLTEGLVQRMSGIDSDNKAMSRTMQQMATTIGQIDSKVTSDHEYLVNLDGLVHREQAKLEKLSEKVLVSEGSAKTIKTVSGSVWAVVGSAIAGITTYLFTKQ